ncbi:PAS domain-containing protein [Sphingomonas sp.]|uniref:PAS domain-containing protein n=1 Tax=Sphingomonas sp. TaxID=28214 RepID=UPI0025F3F47C|nr:PAS domain-containing protein [Sphingomonas sp.]
MRATRMPMLITDPNQTDNPIIFVNDAFCSLTGYARAEILGRNCRFLQGPETKPENIAKIRQAITQRSPIEIEILNYTKDREQFWNRLFVSPVFDDNGDLIYFFASQFDNTAARLAEQNLHDLNNTLEERIAASLNERLVAEDQRRQSQKMEAVGQLTGGVAHDFNNLLTVIRGSTELLRLPDLSDEKRQRYIDAIADTANRATKLTNQLLAFSRRQALQPELFDAVESLRAIRDMVGTLTGSRVKIALDLRAEPCFVYADRSQFDTAIVNMAVNARDAMKAQGNLTIKVDVVADMPVIRAHSRVKGPFVTVALTDTGAGILADKLDQIFEPFFTTKGVGEGTGLGLSQVFGFAKQSGGDIQVQSVQGEGSTFTMYLPLVQTPADPQTIPYIAEKPGIGEGSCILVVEDNTQVGEFATAALTELGYKTTLASNAASALAKLAEGVGEYDAVFSDVAMPGMSGIEMGQQIQRLYPHLPIILTSGYSDVLAQGGAHGFELLHKPYSIEELSRVLQKFADRQSLA